MTRNVFRALSVLGGAVALVGCASGEVERDAPGGFNTPGGSYAPPVSNPPANTGNVGTPNPAPAPTTGGDTTAPTTVTPGTGATNGNNGNTGGTGTTPLTPGEGFGD